MKNILITGSSGSLGKSVVDQITNHQYRLFCPKRRDADLLNEDQLFDYFKKLPPIYGIIHIAGITDTNVINNHSDLNDNIVMTKNIVDVGSKYQIKHFIYISSHSVNYSSRPYAKIKRICEEIVSQSGLTFTIIRPSVIFGPGSPELKRIINIVSKSPIIPLIDGGRQKCRPIFIEDVSKFISLCLKNPIAKNKTFTIAGSQIVTIKDIIQFVSNLVDKDRLLISIPIRLFNPLQKLINLFCPISIKSKLLIITEDAASNINQPTKDLNWTPLRFSDYSKLL